VAQHCDGRRCEPARPVRDACGERDLARRVLERGGQAKNDGRRRAEELEKTDAHPLLRVLLRVLLRGRLRGRLRVPRVL
jgi:hypothetical protein